MSGYDPLIRGLPLPACLHCELCTFVCRLQSVQEQSKAVHQKVGRVHMLVVIPVHQSKLLTGANLPSHMTVA